MKNHKLTLFSLGNFDQTTRIREKYVINMFFQRNSRIFSKFSSNNRICKFLHCNGPKLRRYENTEKSRTDGTFIGKQCLYYRIQRRKPFRTCFCHINHVFPVKMTFCTLFSLIELLKRFRPYIVKNHKLTLFSLGNFDQTTRISAQLRYKHVSSMKLSYFFEVFLQQSYMQVSSLQWA